MLKAIAAVKQMDARNKWTEARKVMKKTEAFRVSFGDEGGISRANHREHAPARILGTRVNALDANARAGMKRTLNAVVEVQYTTSRLEVAE